MGRAFKELPVTTPPEEAKAFRQKRAQLGNRVERLLRSEKGKFLTEYIELKKEELRDRLERANIEEVRILQGGLIVLKEVETNLNGYVQEGKQAKKEKQGDNR